MAAIARILRYATYQERTPHGAYAWVVLIVSLLPYVGYLIFPPFSRLYFGEVAPSAFDRDFFLDYARCSVFIVGLMLSPAIVIAAGLLTYAFRRRPWPRARCVVVFVLALRACAYYVLSISH